MTISVQDTYTLHKGDETSVSDQDAFALVGSGSPVLIINGSVTASGDASTPGYLVAGVHDAGSPADATVNIRHQGTLTVTATGQDVIAVGASFSSTAEFINRGSVLVDGQYDANGVDFAGSTTSSFTNDGDFTVRSDGGAFGIERPGAFDNSGLVHVEGYDANGGTFGSFDNSGRFEVDGQGYAHGIYGQGDFHNTGTIYVHSTSQEAVGVGMDAVGDAFVNEGRIIASALNIGPGQPGSIAIQAGGGSTGGLQVYQNDGLIRGQTAFDSFTHDRSAPQVDIENTGRIWGVIDLSVHDDTINSSGKISGNIHMGDGDDSYHLTGHAHMTGVVFGEAGSDVLSGGAHADYLMGDEAVYDPDFAGGADTLSGGGGDDVLQGGMGADVLTGGAGHDHFVFTDVRESTTAAPDLITDLHHNDRIDLSRIDADPNTSGLQHFHFVAAFDGQVGEATVHYDKASGDTVLQLDPNGDGQADATILVAGHHADLAQFVI